MKFITFLEIIIGGPSNILAELLCIKRTGFNHEN